jgi:hypothetical protein
LLKNDSIAAQYRKQFLGAPSFKFDEFRFTNAAIGFNVAKQSFAFQETWWEPPGQVNRTSGSPAW